jgi:hypothetical protein
MVGKRRGNHPNFWIHMFGIIQWLFEQIRNPKVGKNI